MVALIALDIAFVIGGAYQVEVVFNYYGIGWETIQAIDNLDFPLLQFIVVVGGVAIVPANLVSDFILLLLDPRIKVTGGKNMGATERVVRPGAISPFQAPLRARLRRLQVAG